MDKEPLEAQETTRMTFDELLELSLQEFKKSLGLPSNIVEADPPKTEEPQDRLGGERRDPIIGKAPEPKRY